MTNKFSRFESEFQVRPDDIDMFQHVHNSRYFDYVLAARYDQMEHHYEMSMDDFMQQGYGWVVKTAHLIYKRALRLGDKFVVETGIEEMNDRGCRVTFKICFNESKKTCCEGWFDYVLIDLKSGKSVRVTDEMVKKYSI